MDGGKSWAFTSASQSPPFSIVPNISHHPFSAHSHPLISCMMRGSCSPHPGSGAWGYSTAPDYRRSWSRPPNGSQGHTGNPPGLRPELGGPHPSGTPSHFPGSNKTWSRFGLGKDKKREVGWRRLLPLRKQKAQLGGCALKHPSYSAGNWSKKVCLSSFQSSLSLGNFYTSPQGKKKKSTAM